MHITLRPNERIYLNGAVLRVDRKVSLELMNDAIFLLEAHVMLEKNATTPLRKLYFLVQLMLIEPTDLEPKKIMFNLQALSVSGLYKDVSLQAGVAAVGELVNKGRTFEALKIIRSMLPIEDQLIGGGRPAEQVVTAPNSPSRPAVAAASAAAKGRLAVASAGAPAR